MDKNKWLRVGVGILVLFLVGVFLKLARPILVPFALALLIAFAVSPALDFLVRRKVPKAVALVIILILSFTVLYLIGTVFYSGGKSLAAELPVLHRDGPGFSREDRHARAGPAPQARTDRVDPGLQHRPAPGPSSSPRSDRSFPSCPTSCWSSSS